MATQKVNLNETELKVLNACAQEVINCTNGEFGYTEDIKVEGLSKNQLKGYLSQLVQKSLITPPDSDYSGQFSMRKSGVAIFNLDASKFEFPCYADK